ncbi:lysM and putative peptidoglycan-binding domain-containing protein 3 [Discoglossus pictus]
MKMTGSTPGRGYMKPTSMSSSTSGHNYHFANMAENDMMEDDLEEYELRPRGREKTRRSTSRDRLDDIVFISKDISEGDTLNAIALQYCCTVADLKRANNFINDQDFFALRSIKIPVKRFSVLTETHFSAKASRSVTLQPSSEFQEIVPAVDPPSSEAVGSFLQEVDRDIEKIVSSTNTKTENLQEIVSALGQEVHFDPPLKTTKQKDPFSGADWGLRWWTAVAIMVIVGIVTPVFYFLYFEVLLKRINGNSSEPSKSP